MTGLLFLAGALAMQSAAASPPPDDVVVVGERMRRLKLVTKTDRRTGQQRCIVKRPSGDAALDARMCGVTLACAATVSAWPAMKACLQPQVEAYARDLAARHHAAAGIAPPSAAADPR